MESIIHLHDDVWKLLESRMGRSMPQYDNAYTTADNAYRDALESVSLALQGKGMPIPDILDVLNTALDAYENNAT
jgi:hypothetical protein